MTDLWKDPAFSSGPIRNVLVIGVRKDPVQRRMWEDAFVQELGRHSVTATSSYRLFPDVVPDTLDVIDAIRKNGYGSVLVSVRLPNDTATRYVPGSTRQQLVTEPRSSDRRGFHTRYRTHWVTIQDPGYTETDTFVGVQTDVWLTGDGGRLVWSGVYRTLKSAAETVDEAVSKEIVPQLEKQGMIPGGK